MSKEVTPGYKQTEVGVIPEDWEAVKLGTLASFKSGDGIAVSQLSTRPSPASVPVFGGNGVAGYTTREMVKELTLVVGRVGQKCGEVYLTEGPAWITDNALFPRWMSGKVNVRYLALALRGAGLNAVKNRNDLPLLTQSILHEFAIPLPATKAEQEAIAGALGDADALIDALEHLVAKKRQIKHGAMQELLTGQKRLPGFATSSGYKRTDVGIIPEDWDVRTVGSMGEVRAGKALASRGPGPQRPYLRTKNVFDGRIDLDDVLQMPMTDADFSRYRLRYGDVLLNEGQSIELVGRCAMYKEEYQEPCAIQNQLVRFRARECDSPNFATHLFRYCQISGVFARIAMQTTSVAHLGVSRFHQLQLAWPRETIEQEAIAEMLSDMDALIGAIEAKLAKARQVKQGMMQELLTGRVRLV